MFLRLFWLQARIAKAKIAKEEQDKLIEDEKKVKERHERLKAWNQKKIAQEKAEEVAIETSTRYESYATPNCSSNPN